ncbi:MAG: AAA family ATPase, partial [Candidatus Enterosoma sp.]
MKPILLEMEAFESYLEKTTIDFETLNQKGVFLISGNTGAGKTTIFDAISYALFGKLSTDQREKASQVKTIGADNHRCKVVFVFEEKGQRYQITRTPQQRIKGKKKEYIMEQAISELVFLSDPSIAPLTKAGEVNDKITSLIGLNQSQFFQTTLIAQGAFSKIITATTNDRQQILRSLFHTDIYNDFVSAVLEKKKKISDASASLKQTIDRYYLGVSLSEEDKEKSKEIFDLNDRINFLNLCKDAYSIKRQEFNENIILFDNRINDLTAEKTKLDAYLSDKASLEKLEEDIQGKAEEKDRAQKQREILLNQKNEIDAKEEERQELKLKLPSYEKRDSLRSSLSKVQKELKKYQNDILKPTKDRDDYQAKMKEAQAEIQKIE